MALRRRAAMGAAVTLSPITATDQLQSPRVCVLGPLVIVGVDGAIPVRVGRPRRLIGLLTIRPGVPVAVDTIIDALWGDAQPANARNALQALVSYLRRQFEPISEHVAVERVGDGYMLRFDDIERIDRVDFEQRLSAAETLHGMAALNELDRALALWRGTPYPDAAYDDFAQAEIARVTELQATARERRASILLELGRTQDALEALQVLSAEFPLRESVWCLLMLAMYRAHRQADALRVYAVARDRLIDELGVEPHAEMKELERRVLEQDPTLDWVAPSAPSVVEPDATATDGPAPVAAPHPAAASGYRVPIPLSSLVGRAFEVGQVEQLVTSNRLVTLTGPGGIGKSRLAVEVARRRSAQVAATVVDFGSLGARSDVSAALAAAAGVPILPSVDPIGAVASSRSGAHLWVFETCEHVLASVATAASAMLRLNPDLTILATSRQALGITGEVAWPVPPLEVPDAGTTATVSAAASAAVRLFVERATAARSGFVLDDSNAAAVAEICRRLDGLPLAIELAAARVNLLSPNRIVERLGDRFALLSKGGRDADPRQSSLRATIAWSYSLLEPDEQRFFDRVSVINGEFDLEAAAMIAGPDLDTDAFDVFDALVDQSLIRRVGDDRFAVLDTLRTFGSERLAAVPEDSDRTRHRHADWYLDVALTADPKSHGPLPEHWPRLRQEADNCHTALEWMVANDRLADAAAMAGALAGYWVLDGQIARADRWLNTLRDTDAPDATRASLLRGLGVLEMYRSRFAASRAACAASVAHARRTDDGRLLGSVLLPYGSSLWGLGEYENSAVALEEAVGLFDRAGDRRGSGFALARLGRTAAALDDPAAITHLQRAIERLTPTGDGWMTCVAYEHLAAALLKGGDVPGAVHAGESAVALGRQFGSNSGELVAMSTLARASIAAGDLDAALSLLIDVLRRAIDYANPGVIADALDGAASAVAGAGSHALAFEVLTAADEVRRDHTVQAPAVAVTARSALRQRLADELGADAADLADEAGARRSVESLLTALAARVAR